MLEIRPVRSATERDAFIDLVWRLYRNDPNWVPPLRMELAKHLTPKGNPYFEHAEVELFNAWRDRKVVGRISAQIDHEHNRYHSEKTGMFGFLEAEDDPAIVRELLDTATNWVRSRGMDRVRGPFNFSINHTCGMLIDGFDRPPYVEMTHTLPYYPAMIEAAGFGKVMDLYAWLIDATKPLPELPLQLHEAVKNHPGLRIREVDKREFDRDLRIILDIFNEAWSRNWGYVPMTEGEIRKAADDLKMIIEPKIALIAEIDGEPAAIAITFPNLNQILKRTNGRTNPHTLFRLLWDLKVKRGWTQARQVLLGVRRKFRGSMLGGGLSVHLYVETHRRAAALGVTEGECSWTLANNDKINNGIAMLGATVYKTYRIYEKSLI